jgi:hypothetical protein
LAFNPVMLLVNEPVPVPSVVCGPLTVGLWLVLQHTPRAVTVAPPSEVTSPPQVAVEEALLVATAVVTVGKMGFTVIVAEAVAVQPYSFVPVTV